MKIQLRFRDATFTVHLVDQAATRDLVSMLPLQLKASDFASAEKIAYLPRKLSTQGAPAGTDAQAGDLTYYAPWGNLAFFYRTGSYASGLVHLGRVEGAVDRLGLQEEGEVRIELISA